MNNKNVVDFLAKKCHRLCRYVRLFRFIINSYQICSWLFCTSLLSLFHVRALSLFMAANKVHAVTTQYGIPCTGQWKCQKNRAGSNRSTIANEMLLDFNSRVRSSRFTQHWTRTVNFKTSLAKSNYKSPRSRTGDPWNSVTVTAMHHDLKDIKEVSPPSHFDLFHDSSEGRSRRHPQVFHVHRKTLWSW
jgi:hypothetical protein